MYQLHIIPFGAIIPPLRYKGLSIYLVTGNGKELLNQRGRV